MKLKLPLSSLFCLLLHAQANGQTHEWRVAIHTANMHFRGDATGSSSTLFYERPNEGYAQPIYGKNLGAGYGFTISYEKVLRSNLLLGLGVGYESAQSRSDIERIELIGPPVPGSAKNADGLVKLNQRQLLFRPTIGFQWGSNKGRIRCRIFPEVSPILYVRESGYATTENPFAEFRSSRNRQTIQVDYRLGAIAGYYWKKWGATASYALGFNNYLQDGSTGTAGARAAILRIGVSYQLNR